MDKKSVASGTTASSEVKKRTIVITMIVDASRIWVFRFLTLWVCATLLHMGVESIWYAVVVSNATSALILYILYWTGIWKHRTVKIEKSAEPDPSTT